MAKRILIIAVNPAYDPKSFTNHEIDIYNTGSAFNLGSFLRQQRNIVEIITGDFENINFTKLDEFKPDIVCLAHTPDKKIYEWLELKKPNIIVCWGAGELTLNSGVEALKDKSVIDYAISGGNPEPTWLKLLEYLETGKGIENIKGLTYRVNGEIIKNHGVYDFDMDSLSCLYYLHDTAYITASRGCVGNCSFCHCKNVHPKWLGRNIKKVVDDIQGFVSIGITRFMFFDRTFGSPNIKRVEELCTEIIERKLPIFYSGNFRPDFSSQATPEVMEALVQSGLYRVFIGCESGNQEDLDLYHKRVTVKQSRDTIKLFERYGIHTEIGFINFHPFSTLEGLRKNIDFLEETGFADFETIKSTYKNSEDRPLFKMIDEAGLYDHEKMVTTFQNESVKKLNEYVVGYMHLLQQDNAPKTRYERAVAVYRDNVYLMHYYLKRQMQEQYEAVCEYLGKAGSIIAAMSVVLCSWFRKLLDIAEHGFDQDKALEVSLYGLSSEFVLDMARYLEKENDKLLKLLDELNKQEVA